jgi:hypothetical protein
MLPTVAAAVGVVPEDAVDPEPQRGDGVFALATAAAAAADETGIEVSRADLKGSDLGPRGRWVWVRRRRRHAIPSVGAVDVITGAASIDAAHGEPAGDPTA